MEKNTISGIYSRAFKENWDNIAFSDYEGKSYHFSEIAHKILSLQQFYKKVGLKKGDKIAVLGRNSAHWGTVFLSALYSGMVIVPVLPDFNNENTNHILKHSESKIVISAGSLLDKIDFQNTENLKVVILLEDFSIVKSRDKKLTGSSLDDLTKIDKEGFVFYEWEKEDTCLISYTSGTSGFTKGVMLPERSLYSNIKFAQDNMPLKPGDKIVSFLPMAHVYGLLFEFLFPVTLGCHITFLSKMPAPQVLTKVFGEVRPHLILSVPLVIEKIYKKRLLPTISKPAIVLLLKIPGISSLLLKKIKSKLMETFGGRFFEIVIGGAPLSADVEGFFRRINFPFTIGYGMTECGPLISYAAWNKTQPLSAGKLVDRMQVRIDSEDPYKIVGEIQVKGENTMSGYFKNEIATKETFTEDGWLRTGDLGIIDKENFIYIRGRSKNMILGPSGQNIYPEEIEAKLSNTSYVSECVIKVENSKLIGLVYPDFEAMKNNQIQEDNLDEIMELNRKRVNQQLAKYEQISKIQLVNEEFEKTPKRNIKRYKYL